MFKANRLFNVDSTIDIGVQERGFHIELVDKETVTSRMSEEKANRCGLDDWSKGVFEVDMVNLSKSSGDETSFEARVQGFSILDFECKSGSDNPATVGTRYDGVCAVFIEGSKFLNDSGGPLCRKRRRHGLFEGPRLVRRSIGGDIMRRRGVKRGTGVCDESLAV